MAIASVCDVADFLLCFSKKHGDVLTNLKLQKLLYYSQAWYLVIFGDVLFDEQIEAWVHGPVVYSVWDRFKVYQWSPITEEPRETNLPLRVKEHLIEIFRVFGKYTAYDLELMTHKEEPWKKARHGLPVDEASNNVIAVSDMKEFYLKLANNNG